MTKAQYFTEIVTISVHTMQDRIPSALCGVNWPPVACTTVCRVYKGLVPRSPNTTPSAAKLAKRAGCESSAWRLAESATAVELLVMIFLPRVPKRYLTGSRRTTGGKFMRLKNVGSISPSPPGCRLDPRGIQAENIGAREQAIFHGRVGRRHRGPRRRAAGCDMRIRRTAISGVTRIFLLRCR